MLLKEFDGHRPYVRKKDSSIVLPYTILFIDELARALESVSRCNYYRQHQLSFVGVLSPAEKSYYYIIVSVSNLIKTQ